MKYFEPLEKTKTITSWSHITIAVDEIVEFTVLEKVFKIHQFKSIEYVYDFLELNRNDITHIIWVTTEHHSVVKNEVFLKEQKQHNLSGYARICSCYANSFGGVTDLIEEDKYYFVENKQIKEEEFLRLQREEKFKRITK